MTTENQSCERKPTEIEHVMIRLAMRLNALKAKKEKRGKLNFEENAELNRLEKKF